MREQTVFYGQVGERLHLLHGVALMAQRACVRDIKALSLMGWLQDGGGKKGEKHDREESMEKGI